MRYLVAIAALTITGTSFGADVPGWQDLVWGMTEAQVKELHPEIDFPELESGASAGHLTFEIADQQFKASLAFNSEGLWHVLVVPVPEQLRTPKAMSVRDDLLDLLLAKYGSPTHEETKQGRIFEDGDLIWTGPSGSLEFSYLIAPGEDSILFLAYNRPDEDRDKI